MLKKLVLLFLFSLTFGFTIKQSNQTLNGLWTLVCFEDYLAGKQDCKSQYIQKFPITLEFKDDGKSGTMTGHTSSNNVTGDYRILDVNKIKVESFGGTKRGEITTWGSQFWNTISQSSAFEYKSDTLVIYYENNAKAMKFTKTEKVQD